MVVAIMGGSLGGFPQYITEWSSSEDSSGSAGHQGDIAEHSAHHGVEGRGLHTEREGGEGGVDGGGGGGGGGGYVTSKWRSSGGRWSLPAWTLGEKGCKEC